MTEKKLAANRRNALKSTGPKTPEGKKRASMNALRHGLRAVSLAVPTMENPEDWEAHRSQVLRDLAPVGYLETILSERAAALFWRLGRVVRYESLSVTTDLENVVEDYVQSKRFDHDFRPPEDLTGAAEAAQEDFDLFTKLPTMKASAKLEPMAAWCLVDMAAVAVDLDLYEEDPEDANRQLYTIDLSEVPDTEDVEEWDGWTAGYLRTVLDRVVKKAEADPRVMREAVLLKLAGNAFTAKTKADAVLKQLERKRRERLLPNETVLEKVSRYEVHLERSLFRVLHELQRLQAARSGMALPPPAAVDLDVSVHGEAS